MIQERVKRVDVSRGLSIIMPPREKCDKISSMAAIRIPPPIPYEEPGEA
jgi:hypothetical protein